MARSTSTASVREEVSIQEEMDREQEPRLRNGLQRRFVSPERRVDENPNWFRRDANGNLIHRRINPI